MTRADELVEQGAARLEAYAHRTAAEGGLKAKIAETLLEDAQFLRQLKPSLIAARARGEAPTNLPPGTGTIVPSAPQLGPRPEANGSSKPGGGRSPLVLIGAAFVVGILLAKMIDWRGHAHPKL